MPPILACLSDRLFEAARTAIPHLDRVGSLAEVRSLLRTSRVDGLIVDPALPGQGGPEELFWLATDFPALHITVYTVLDAAVAQALVRLAAAGISDVVLFGYEDSADRWDEVLVRASVRDSVSLALRRAEPVLRRLDPSLSYALQDTFHNPRKFRTVDQLATVAGTSRRGVYRKLHRAGMRAVRDWIDWGRLVNAFGLIRCPGRTAAQTARLVGYADGGDLATHVQRIAGFTMQDFSTRVSAEELVDRMSERLLVPAMATAVTRVAAAAPGASECAREQDGRRHA